MKSRRVISDHATPAGADTSALKDLQSELDALVARMLGFESSHAQIIDGVAPSNHRSARNLLHYLAMRQLDLRALQTRLATLGLSSIGRAESHALYAVQSVAAIARRLGGGPAGHCDAAPPYTLESGTAALDAHTDKLFGPPPPDRTVRVMLTMPSEAAHDYTLVRSLLEAGMDCMRINCAHDGPEAWLSMIEHLRQACRASGRHCTVLMDVAGPKLRTGEIGQARSLSKRAQRVMPSE